MVAHDLTTTLDRLLSAERTVVYADDRSVASVASEAKRIFSTSWNSYRSTAPKIVKRSA